MSGKLSWNSGKPCLHLNNSKREIVARKKQMTGRSPTWCDLVAEVLHGQTWRNQVRLQQSIARGVRGNAAQGDLWGSKPSSQACPRENSEEWIMIIVNPSMTT